MGAWPGGGGVPQPPNCPASPSQWTVKGAAAGSLFLSRERSSSARQASLATSNAFGPTPSQCAGPRLPWWRQLAQGRWYRKYSCGLSQPAWNARRRAVVCAAAHSGGNVSSLGTNGPRCEPVPSRAADPHGIANTSRAGARGWAEDTSRHVARSRNRVGWLREGSLCALLVHAVCRE